MVASSSGIIVTDDSWTVHSAAGVAIASRWLQAVQPQTLDIDIPADVPTPKALKHLCRIIQQKFTGILNFKLWGSYLNYENCSELMEIIVNKK